MTNTFHEDKLQHSALMSQQFTSKTLPHVTCTNM